MPNPVEVPDIEWIFGYGSLMWRPGFPFIEQRRARLDGYHRAPCVYSHHHRGTATRPGLVLGLDKGNYCIGIAFKIDIKNRPQIIDYLHKREMAGYAYKAAVVNVDIGEWQVPAFTYVADPDHPNYAGALDEEVQADLIMAAQGISGLNRDYLIATVQKLLDEDIVETALASLLRVVKRKTGEIESGGGI